MDDFSSLGNSLGKTLKSSDLSKMGANFTEMAIDQFLEKGLLKDIPVINSILSVGNAVNSVRDYLFIKKLVSFLTEVSDLPVEERSKMIQKIDESSKYKINVGEKLLYILDKCHDHEKSKVIAQFFSVMIKGELTYKEFLEASNVIENITSEQLNYFVETDWGNPNNDEYAVNFMYTGLFAYDTLLTDGTRQKDGRLTRGSGDKNFWSELVPFVSSIGSKIRYILSKK